jgi:hypothetical protein
MKKLIPVLLALIGLTAGGGAGYFLRPPPEEALAENPCGEGAAPATQEAEPVAEGEPTVEYVKLNNQFVIPIVENGQVTALVILSLSLEVKVGATEKVYAAEPKLRDNLLQVMFDHANAGGFKGAFTDTANMETLRKALLEASRSVLGNVVTGVLVSDIVRQDTR